MREDLFEILHAIRGLGVTSGITTNGLLLNDRNIEKLLTADIFNINISIDSMNPKIHDSLRGVEGVVGKSKTKRPESRSGDQKFG